MSETKCDTCDGPHTTPCDRLKAETRRQHCSQISMKALTCSVLEHEDEIEQLKAVCEDSNAVCVCGCSPEDHEQYDDDGECCEHEDHECIRTSQSVANIVFGLRARVAELEEEDKIERLTRERDEARAFGVDASEKYNALLIASADVTCAFCGQEYPRGTPRHGDGALADHIKVCAKHPMREMQDGIDTAIELLTGAQGDGWPVETLLDAIRHGKRPA